MITIILTIKEILMCHYHGNKNVTLLDIMALECYFIMVNKSMKVGVCLKYAADSISVLSSGGV